MQHFYEKQIIQGIANGIILPSEISLDASNFNEEEIGLMFAPFPDCGGALFAQWHGQKCPSWCLRQA